MRGLILGTGYSLKSQLDLIPRFDGLVFGPNNTFKDFRLDVWLACDPTWHEFYGPVRGEFDKWHWDKGITGKYGYRHVQGVWLVNGVAYPREKHITPPGECGGLWLKDKSKISLNHGSCPQLINLAANQYECDEIVLVGHDFHYDAPQRHYFDTVSDQKGEYPAQLRKWSKFIKDNGQHDLLAVYKSIADQDGRPQIWNATPGSKLPWFPHKNLEEFCTNEKTNA